MKRCKWQNCNETCHDAYVGSDLPMLIAKLLSTDDIALCMELYISSGLSHIQVCGKTADRACKIGHSSTQPIVVQNGPVTSSRAGCSSFAPERTQVLLHHMARTLSICTATGTTGPCVCCIGCDGLSNVTSHGIARHDKGCSCSEQPLWCNCKFLKAALKWGHAHSHKMPLTPTKSNSLDDGLLLLAACGVEEEDSP